MKPLSLTPNTFSALCLAEQAVATLEFAEKQCGALGNQALALAMRNSIAFIKKAHEAVVAEAQRTVSIAAPSDVQALLHDPVKT